MAGGTSAIEAITIFIVGICVFYIFEIVAGGTMDQLAYVFGNTYIPGVDPEIVGPILAKFGMIHQVTIIIIISLFIWAIRVTIFQHGYSRNRGFQ